MTWISSQTKRPAILRWLALLRWGAVFGQSSAIMCAASVFKLQIPWIPLLLGVLLASFSNHWLPDLANRRRDAGKRRMIAAIAGDTVLLTWMLYWTGGAHNPFTVFYLLHLALAAMLLGTRGLLFVSCLYAVCFALVSFFHVPFRGPEKWVQDGLLVYPLHRAASATALVLAGGVLVLLVHRMYRAQLAGEQDLADAERKASEAERFKSLATLAAGVAHEMGTPLGTIAVASKELERAMGKDGIDPELRADALLIRSEVERCRAILKRLDARTTGGAGSAIESVTASLVMERLAGRLAAPVRSRIEFHDLTGNREIRLALEPAMQSLIVLIENACDADVSGGAVVLEVKIEGGRSVVFRVLDRGAGMAEAVRRRAGEPYFTTKTKDGTGLGLFLVRTLILELGGEVSLHPRPDGGTCAVLSLPFLTPTNP